MPVGLFELNNPGPEVAVGLHRGSTMPWGAIFESNRLPIDLNTGFTEIAEGHSESHNRKSSRRSPKAAENSSLSVNLLDAGVSGGWWGVVFFGGRAKQFDQDRLQRVGPDLVPLYDQMQSVRSRHTFEQMAPGIREPIVDV